MGPNGAVGKRFAGAAEGYGPDYYRMAELYFPSRGDMQATLASAEGQAAVADLPNFATGGVTFLEGKVDP